ncbi:CDC123 [Candida theae]|uniref:Translation initiation factor eIF2 assembly protein n=1 Tax=Candida theae TaxID=1198502 RepID=A0AAD5FWL6_9ASCO|nr:CDC123 [Candida theae]KAI5949240.1 CDC123 [Candida theae]
MGEDYTTFEKSGVTQEEILKCSFSNWCDLFKDHLFPYRVINPLPPTFIDYLLSDGIKLATKQTRLEQTSDNEYSDWDEDETDNSDPPHLKFIHLHDQISKYVEKLGGKVIPKLNWSSPKDASWLLPGNTIKSIEANDIYLLLKSSDHIVDDLLYPFSEVEDPKDVKVAYELVLKKWEDINPALEFRVFVKDGNILGISQRDLNYYDFLKDLEPELNARISKFVYNEVIPNLKVEKFILDVYIPRPFDKVYIIDINPFSRKSESLLFTWNELLTRNPKDDNEYEFRLINETNLAAFAKKQYSESQVPIDVVGAANDTEALINLAREWEKLQTKDGSISP